MEIGDKHGQDRCYTNLGNAYYNLDDHDKAIEYLKRGLGIAVEVGNEDLEGKGYAEYDFIALKIPCRYIGLDSLANAKACSGGNLYFLLLGSYSIYPLAT